MRNENNNKTTDQKETTMTEMFVANETEAKTAAIAVSKASPGKYVVLHSCFGLFIRLCNSLDVQAPTDSCYDWYVLNGTVRYFTDRQKAADFNAALTMS